MSKVNLRLEEHEYETLLKLAEEWNMSVNGAINHILWLSLKKTKKASYDQPKVDLLRGLIKQELNDSNHDFFTLLAKIKKQTALMVSSLSKKYKDNPDEFRELNKHVERNYGLYYAGLEMESPYWELKEKFGIEDAPTINDTFLDEMESDE